MDWIKNTCIVLKIVSAHGSIYSFNKYLLIIYYVPGTILGSGETAMNKNQTYMPAFMEFAFEIINRLIQHTVCPMEVKAVEKFKVGEGERGCHGQVRQTGHSIK